MRSVIVAIVAVLFAVFFLTAALEATSGNISEEFSAEKQNENGAEKKASLKDYIVLILLLVILLSIPIGVHGYTQYRRKIPWKFAVVEILELVISIVLTLILSIVFRFLLGIEEFSIVLTIWTVLVFYLILEFFYTYVNLPLFGYKRTSQFAADKKQGEEQENKK